jgi:hypothetical protein
MWICSGYQYRNRFRCSLTPNVSKDASSTTAINAVTLGTAILKDKRDYKCTHVLVCACLHPPTAVFFFVLLHSACSQLNYYFLLSQFRHHGPAHTLNHSPSSLRDLQLRTNCALESCRLESILFFCMKCYGQWHKTAANIPINELRMHTM